MKPVHFRFRGCRPPPLAAASGQDLHELCAERAHEAVDQEAAGGVQSQDEVCEGGEALFGVDAVAVAARGHDLAGEDDFVDRLDHPGQVTDEEDDDDGGQRGRVVGLVSERGKKVEKSTNFPRLYLNWKFNNKSIFCGVFLMKCIDAR